MRTYKERLELFEEVAKLAEGFIPIAKYGDGAEEWKKEQHEKINELRKEVSALVREEVLSDIILGMLEKKRQLNLDNADYHHKQAYLYRQNAPKPHPRLAKLEEKNYYNCRELALYLEMLIIDIKSTIDFVHKFTAEENK